MRFEEVAEVQQGRGIRHALGTQINPRKTLERLTVVERVFEGFIGQAIPLLEEINPQHPLQADVRTSALALGIKGFDDGQQLRPRNHRVHAREKPFAAGSLLFGGKLGVGETRLMRHAAKFKPTTRSRRLESQARGLNQRFLNEPVQIVPVPKYIQSAKAAMGREVFEQELAEPQTLLDE